MSDCTVSSTTLLVSHVQPMGNTIRAMLSVHRKLVAPMRTPGNGTPGKKNVSGEISEQTSTGRDLTLIRGRSISS